MAEIATPHDELDNSEDRDAFIAHRLARSDAGNAEFFTYLYGSLVRYDHSRNRWLVWDSHRWRPDDDANVYRMALESVRARLAAVVEGVADADERKKLAKFAIGSESRPRQDALLALARTMVPIADSGKGWDETPGLLGVPNGVVDLRTGELRDGHPEDRITMSTGIDYDPTATCPRWDRFLLEVLEDEDVARYLQRLVGYSLTAEAKLHLLIFLMGVGRNGKGTFIRLLERALGDYAQVISSHAFAAERRNAHSTEVADLELSRFAYCEELGDGTLNAERLKDLSGGGTKVARKMRENTRQFRQTWQLWFTTNKLPKSDDNTWGFWSRLVAIAFPNQFKAEDEPTLEETLADELPGILAWAVRGSVEWYRDGLGETPVAVIEKTAEYREDMDPVEPIIQRGYFARCDDDIWTPTETLFLAYKEYAETAGILPEYRLQSETSLGKRLSDQYRGKRRKVALADGSKRQFHGFHGIRVGNVATEAIRGWTSWTVEPDGKTTAPAQPLQTQTPLLEGTA